MAELEALERAYLSDHVRRSSSPKTVEHYKNTFIAFHLFLDGQGIARDSRALSTDVIGDFAVWLKETPTQKPWRGKAERSIVTIHGLLNDIRAFVRWLVDAGKLETLPTIHLPKLPQTLFPILSDEELVAIFSSQQMAQDTEIGKRNRALISFMLDPGVRLAEVADLKLEDVHLPDGVAKVWGRGLVSGWSSSPRLPLTPSNCGCRFEGRKLGACSG